MLALFSGFNRPFVWFQNDEKIQNTFYYKDL